MKLRIKITGDILKKSMLCGHGEEMVLNNCAVALACREIFPDCYVDDSYLRPFGNRNNEELFIKLPPAARIFIRRFDSLASQPELRLNLPETEFEVELPQQLVDAINIEDLLQVLKSSSTLELLDRTE
jgi:hypothetical protein